MHPLMMGVLGWIEYQQRLQLEDASSGFPVVCWKGNSLIQLIRDVVRELARQGATKVVIVNGHWCCGSYSTEVETKFCGCQTENPGLMDDANRFLLFPLGTDVA